MYWFLAARLLIKSLMLPPIGPLLLAIVGVALYRRRPAIARVLIIVGLGTVWLVATPRVSDVLSSWAEAYPPLDYRRAAEAQVIVILGGGGQRAYAPEYGGPAADPILLERLSYGAFVARKTGLPILVTGMHIETTAMADTLRRNFGIEPRWVDDQSHDTFENARNSMRLLRAQGISRIVLVTRATHMRRSVHEFTDAGAKVVPAPAGMWAPRELGAADYLPNPEATLRSHYAIYELIGETVRRFMAATHLRRQVPATG